MQRILHALSSRWRILPLHRHTLKTHLAAMLMVSTLLLPRQRPCAALS
jgi:hypothetical protein